MESYCPTCELVGEVEAAEDGAVMCLSCGDSFLPSSKGGPLENYCVGKVLEVETVAKSKELKKALVQIAEGKTAQIVTNAKHCNPGMVVIVALVGAVVPVGADKDGPDTVIVQPANISGVKSEGMFCDCPMMGWSGGAKGIIVVLDDTYAIGSVPPSTRPRPN